jgi:hypothetical protein
MLHRQGKFLRFVERRPLVARVTVGIDTATPEPYIRVTCCGCGSLGFAQLREAPSDGCEDWKAGAIEGAVYALRLAGRLRCGLVISKIIGLTGNTTPAAVAAAAAEAVWAALDYHPSTAIVRRLEDEVVAGDIPA